MMLIFLLLLLLLWYSLKDRGPSAVMTDGLKARTEIHAPVRQEAGLTAFSRTVDYRRAADEFYARDRLAEAEREFDNGWITAEEFHRKATPLVSVIGFRWPVGADSDPAGE